MEENKFDNDEDEVVEVENVSPSKQIDRFHKRLDVYRTRQNGCKLRVEQTFNELTEQQSSEITVLRNKFLEEKPKRINKKASRKPLDLDRVIKSHIFYFLITPTIFYLRILKDIASSCRSSHLETRQSSP